MDFHTWFLVLFYGFAVFFKVYEAISQRRQEKKLADSLDKLDKFLRRKSLR